MMKPQSGGLLIASESSTQTVLPQPEVAEEVAEVVVEVAEEV